VGDDVVAADHRAEQGAQPEQDSKRQAEARGTYEVVLDKLDGEARDARSLDETAVDGNQRSV
jgi:hypothetical protein